MYFKGTVFLADLREYMTNIIQKRDSKDLDILDQGRFHPVLLRNIKTSSGRFFI